MELDCSDVVKMAKQGEETATQLVVPYLSREKSATECYKNVTMKGKTDILIGKALQTFNFRNLISTDEQINFKTVVTQNTIKNDNAARYINSTDVELTYISDKAKVCRMNFSHKNIISMVRKSNSNTHTRSAEPKNALQFSKKKKRFCKTITGPITTARWLDSRVLWYLNFVVVSSRHEERLLVVEANGPHGPLVIVELVHQRAHAVVPQLDEARVQTAREGSS